MNKRYFIITNDNYFYYGVQHFLCKIAGDHVINKIVKYTLHDFSKYLMGKLSDDDIFISAPDTNRMVTCILKVQAWHNPVENYYSCLGINEEYMSYCKDSSIILAKHLVKMKGNKFTPTEQCMLKYIARGHDISGIATLTQRSIKAISTHKSNFKSRFQCASDLELISIAMLYFSTALTCCE